MIDREHGTAVGGEGAPCDGRRELWIGLALCLLAVAYRVAMVYLRRVDTDEGEQMALAYGALAGRRPYCDVPWIFPPLYAQLLKVIILSFGETVRAIVAARLCSVVISAVTMWQLWRLGRALHGRTAAWVMPLLFTFTSFSAVTGGEIRTDALLVCLLAVAARILIPLGLSSPPWRFFAAGCMMAAATLTKQSAFIFGACLAVFFVWQTWPEWRVDLATARRALLRAFAAVLPTACAWVLAGAATVCPAMFWHETLTSVPQLHSSGPVDYVNLRLGFLLNPAMTTAIFAAAALVAVDAIGVRRVSAGVKLAALFTLPAAALALRARPFSEHYFIPVALAFALLGGAAIRAIGERWPAWRTKAAYLAVALLALNAAALDAYTARYTPSGRYFDPRPPDEFFDRQMATIDFVLRHTPPGAPVLGSHPLWMFRPGGYMNPPSAGLLLLEEVVFPWEVTPERRERLVADLVRLPAVFAVLDGPMLEIMRRYPAIDARVRGEFDIVEYVPGRAILGVSRARGAHVPRTNLAPATP